MQLSFLDVLIGCSYAETPRTMISRKKTFTALLMNYFFFCVFFFLIRYIGLMHTRVESMRVSYNSD